MIADKVTVLSRALESETAYRWEAEGTDGYTVKEAEKEAVGTQIVLSLKANTEDENYDEFLTERRKLMENKIKEYYFSL